jgi:hypothetical protein
MCSVEENVVASCVNIFNYACCSSVIQIKLNMKEYLQEKELNIGMFASFD